MIEDVFLAFRELEKLALERKDRAIDRPNGAPEDVVFGIGDSKRWWEAVLKQARVKNFRWHDLRHTFCSRLAQAGVSLKVIQEAAGHKTIAMSARYAHRITRRCRTRWPSSIAVDRIKTVFSIWLDKREKRGHGRWVSREQS